MWADRDQDRVVKAAPILGYMKRGKWTRAKVRQHCARQGWRVSVVSQMERHTP